MKLEQPTILCPSHRARPGAKLLGVRQSDDQVVILPQPLPVDEAFFESLHEQGIVPEESFRFANKCVEKGCHQWTGEACSVIEKVLHTMHHLAEEQQSLPPCSIRPQCRWHEQRGTDACKVCTYVITQTVEEIG